MLKSLIATNWTRRAMMKSDNTVEMNAWYFRLADRVAPFGIAGALLVAIYAAYNLFTI